MLKTAVLTLSLWLCLASTAFASTVPLAGAAKSAGRVVGFLIVIALIVGAIVLLTRTLRRRT